MPSMRVVGLCFIWLSAVLSGCDRTVVPESGPPQPAKTESLPAPGETSGPGESNSSMNQDSDAPAGPLLSASDSAGDKQSSELTLGADRVPAKSDSTLSAQEPPTAENRIVSVEVQKSNDPAQMLLNLQEIDRSIETLLRTQSQMEPDKFHENAVKLSQMKLESAKHLAGLPQASTDQVKQALKEQLVALSHLSGLRDVAAAKQLEQFAKALSQDADPDLKHQGQVVLLGFTVQNLQNGLISDPDVIVQAVKELVANPQFRTRLEMTSLQHAVVVLGQMGYHDQVAQLQQCAFESFSASTDQPLRLESWNLLVANSELPGKFMDAISPVEGQALNVEAAIAAATELVNQFPNLITLEMLSGAVSSLDYAGQTQMADQLASLIESRLKDSWTGVSREVCNAVLDEHRTRMNWLGRPLEMPELADQDGQKLDLSGYQGKVVLVYFWATDSLPCLTELPMLLKTYSELHDQGLELLSICMDEDSSQLTVFAKEQRLPWRLYSSAATSAAAITQQFGITMFPHTMLVGRDGKVAKLMVRGDSIAAQVKLLLQ